MKIIEIITDANYKDSIEGIAEHFNADIWFGPINEDGRISARLLVHPKERQAVLDDLQGMVHSAPNTRILILPVETVLPKDDEEELFLAFQAAWDAGNYTFAEQMVQLHEAP